MTEYHISIYTGKSEKTITEMQQALETALDHIGLDYDDMSVEEVFDEELLGSDGSLAEGQSEAERNT